MFSLHILKQISIFCIVVGISSGFEQKCKRYYKGNCTNVIYTYENNITNITKYVNCTVCHDEGIYYNVTICTADQFNITVPYVLMAVPHDIENLIISFDNVWYGYLPLKPDPIELEFINRLNNMKYFQISNNYYQFYQFYPLLIRQYDLQNLTLTQLRLRLPLMDNDHPTSAISLLDIVRNLPLLEVLDLSFTRGLGLKKIFDIMKASNNETIQRMCFRMIQLSGGLNYESKFPYFNDANIVFENVVELDISDNAISNMLPGISNMFPNLIFLNIKGNMLLDIGNMVFNIEAIVHPKLQIFYAGYQGNQLDEFTSAFTAKHNSSSRPSIPKSFKQMLSAKAFHFIIDCVNSASGNDNISSIMLDSFKSCNFLVCLIPSILQKISCENQKFIPPLGKMLNPDCLFFVNLPIGLNLREIQFSNVHLEYAETTGVSGQKVFCLSENNSLEVLEFQNNNKWMQSAQLQNIIQRLTGVANFESLRIVDISNNAIDITANNLFNGVFPNITHLDISRNRVNLTSYCNVIPNVESLILSNSNTSYVDPSLVKDCTKLNYLNLDFNYLDVRSLNNLNLLNTRNLRYISMKHCSIHYLEYEFIQKLNTYNNITIDLSNNPFSCGCDEASQNFTKWLIEANNGKFNIVNFDQLLCSGPGGDESLSKLDVKTYWSLCQTYSLETLIVSIMSTLSASILLALIVVVYRIRWRLRYIIFKIQQLWKQICTCSGGSRKLSLWKYDAFISYCAEDRFWVHETLMKTLEGKHGFRLCIHYRDFPVGGDIAETISNSMMTSREIIIVLSDVAVKSEWCNFELDEALRQINRRTQHLIVIKLGKIKTNLLNSKIAHILDTHTFLEWSDNNKHHKLFWATLVGKLYNDPNGQCTCCCPYGARSLGYEDIIDPHEDKVDEFSHEFLDEVDLSLLPAEATQRWDIGVNAKQKALKAQQFKSTFEELLKNEDLPQWAFGPIPWPVDQLLQNDRRELEDQVYTHAKERIMLLIKCLSKQVEIETNVCTAQIEKILQLKQQSTSEESRETAARN